MPHKDILSDWYEKLQVSPAAKQHIILQSLYVLSLTLAYRFSPRSYPTMPGFFRLHPFELPALRTKSEHKHLFHFPKLT